MKLVLLGLMFALVAAGAGNCNLDIPVQWAMQTIYFDGYTANAIQGDGSPYVHGQNGVDRAVINICSGTGDATLLLKSGGNSRSMSLSFAKMLASTPNTPGSALSGSTITGQFFFNVRNLWEFSAPDRLSEHGFTTHMLGGDLLMLNPNAEAATVKPGSPNAAIANLPYRNSLVNVYHCPANSSASSGLCALGGNNTETWFLWPDPNLTESGPSQTGLPKTQVATLKVTKGNSTLNGGEFSMPFYFVISALQ